MIKQKIKNWLNNLRNYKKKEAWISLWNNKIKPFLTWRMILVFGGVWLITTGWAWVFMVVGPALDIAWMTKVGIGAQVVFWNPIINEKLITVPFSIWLHKKIFGHSPDLEVIKDETN